MDAMIIPVMALSIPILVGPFAIVCGHLRRLREMEHRERMAALELGRMLPGDEPWWSPARISIAFGVVVPLAALMVAWISGESMHYPRAESIQVICGLIGVSSVFTGGFLGSRHIAYYHHARSAERLASMTSKPSFDPDSFDVVGTRGR